MRKLCQSTKANKGWNEVAQAKIGQIGQKRGKKKQKRAKKLEVNNTEKSEKP